MSVSSTPPESATPVTDFLLKWTPRAVAVAIGGYYGLGIAYEMGLMAAIDQFAIQVIKNFGGYVGIGALMPTVQWYSAWAVRIVMGIASGILYDLAERAVQCFYLQITAREQAAESQSI
ncbi:MAG: hypothetical protein K1X28_07910 [Parachlamydiales bacterium]|nr:hypothetical protein [Parachlamydiales bacterium]